MTERILGYIDGEMTQEERLAFEADLKNDVALKEDYKILLASRKVSRGFLEAEIRGYFDVLDNKESKKQKLGFSSLSFYVIILCIIGLVLYIIYKSNFANNLSEDKNLYAMQYEPPIWPIVRGEENLVSMAVILHLDGKTDDAIQLLSVDSIMTNESKYWAAEILVNADRCRDAKIHLELLEAFDGDQQRISFLKKYCDKR